MKKIIYVLTILIVACSNDNSNSNDTTAPIITLDGLAIATVNLNSTYTDAGATAMDDVDGDLTSSIVITGVVNTSIEGNYIITYTVSDTSGNIATATRQVVVGESINQMSLSGIVLKSGENTPIENVNITTIPITTSVLTDENGMFTIENISPGEYTVEAKKNKYRSSFETIIINDEQEGEDENIINFELESLDYFPLTVGSFWNYDNQVTEQQESTRDSLYVSGRETIDNINYYQLNALEPVAGFMINLLSQSSLNTNEYALLLNGEFGTPPVEGFPEISIPLVDLIIYDLDENNGSLLSEFSGEIQEVIEEIPVKIGYTITTVQGEIFEDGFGDYTNSNVLSSKININLSIVAEYEILGTILDLPILQSQDVIRTTNYFADGIGMIYSDTQVEYELEDLSILETLGITLPFPSEDSSNSSQNLDTYNLEN